MSLSGGQPRRAQSPVWSKRLIVAWNVKGERDNGWKPFNDPGRPVLEFSGGDISVNVLEMPVDSCKPTFLLPVSSSSKISVSFYVFDRSQDGGEVVDIHSTISAELAMPECAGTGGGITHDCEDVTEPTDEAISSLLGITIQGARAIDTTSTTWTTPDASSGSLEDPLTQVPYVFEHNNTIKYSDPTGYASDDDRRPDQANAGDTHWDDENLQAAGVGGASIAQANSGGKLELARRSTAESKKKISDNQLRQQIRKGQAPPGVDRLDKEHVPGDTPHVHLGPGEGSAAINKDGSIRHPNALEGPISNRIWEWIKDWLAPGPIEPP